MRGQAVYEAVPLDELERRSPSRQHRRKRSDPTAHVRTSWRKRALLLAVSVVAFLFFFNLSPGKRRLDVKGEVSVGPTAWGLAEEAIQTSWLAKPFEDVRLSIMQAVIRDEASTYRDTQLSSYFLQVLAFYEAPITERRPVEWQALIRDPALFSKITCTLDLPSTGMTTTVTAWTRIPEPGWALLIHCPLSEAWQSGLGLNSMTSPPSSLEVTLSLLPREADIPTSFSLSLRPYHPSVPSPHQVGVCIAPRYGDFRFHDMLEWREHHALLGIGPVHWYTRPGPHSASLDRFLTSYKALSPDLKDTLRLAPPISPEVYATDLLEAQGRYADQVSYALDCIMRSIYLAPTPWIAFIDLDELLLPDPFPLAPAEWSMPLMDLLGGQESDVGSVQLIRTHPVGPTMDLAGVPKPLFLSQLQRYRPPKPEDHWDNGKQIGRVDAMELPSVHRVEHFYPAGFRAQRLDNSTVRLLHMRHEFGDGPFDDLYEFSPALQTFARALSNSTETLAALVLDAEGQPL